MKLIQTAITFVSLVLVTSALLVPQTTFAAFCENDTVGGCLDRLIGRYEAGSQNNNRGLPTEPDVNVLIIRLIRELLAVAAVLAVLALVVGGLMYILSLGDESRAARAKKVMLYALIGLIITAVAGIIVYTVGTILTVVQ